MDELLATLGEEARVRPEPTLRGSMVAAGAVLAVVGLFAIAVDSGDGDTNVVGIVLGLVALAAGHALLVSLPAHVRPAGITFIALGTAMALGFLLDDLDSPSLLLFLLVIAFGGQWLFGPARGASVLLTLALLAMWAFLLDTVAGDDASQGAAVPLSDIAVPESTFTSGDDTVSYASLLIGVGLLLATRVLDGRGFQGMATSAVIVGDVAFVIGVFGVVATFDDDAAGSLFIILAGLVLAFVGSGGTRRFTTWLGGIGVLLGLLALLTTAVEFDDAVQFGLAAIAVGTGIVLAVAFVTTPSDTPPADAVAASADGATAETAAEPDTESDTDELPATPPVAEPEATQGWHADPSGRHQLRWHDGTAWTNHVSDAGETSTDEGL